MTLKQVVLPAPFGPIRPRISPVLMWKDTPSRAVTPPKRSVTSSTSSSLPLGRSAISSTEMSTEVSGVVSTASARVGSRVVSGMGRSFLEDLCLDVCLFGSHRSARWHQTLGAEDRQGHQREAEEHEPGVGEEPELLGGPGEQERGEDDAPAVALATHDDHRDEEHGVLDGEVVRVDELLLGGEERTRQTADG